MLQDQAKAVRPALDLLSIKAPNSNYKWENYSTNRHRREIGNETIAHELQTNTNKQTLINGITLILHWPIVFFEWH